MSTDYLVHLLWFLPVILVQWMIAGRVFRRNLRAILIPPLIIGTWYSIGDSVAIFEEIWYFDPALITGIHIGPIPIEEVIFFYLTALVVAQSVVMLLPAKYRR